MTPDNLIEIEKPQSNFDFFEKHVIKGKAEALIDPESASQTFDMEIWFHEGELDLEDYYKDKLLKLGVDIDKKAEIDVVNEEGNIQMRGWKTSNPDWTVFQWKREYGVQILALEETMTPDFIESLGYQIKTQS